MSALSYMQRRVSGTYEFRRRLPEMLAGKSVPAHMRDAFFELINAKTGCFKRELVRSLGTTAVKEAKRRDHREALRASHLFEAAVKAITGDADRPGLAPLNSQEIENEVLAELLAGDVAERADGDDRRLLQTTREREKWHLLEPAVPIAPGMPLPTLPAPNVKGMTKDHFLSYGDLLEELEGEYREAWARSDPTIVHAETQIALKRRGIRLDRSSPDFHNVAFGVLRAHVRAYEAMAKRQGGEIVETPVPSGDRGLKLSEAFEVWKTGGSARGAKKPNVRTADEAEQAIRYFRELHGDMRLGDITREKARQFRDALAKVPSDLPKNLRKLPLPSLLECDLSPYRPRSAATVNKFLGLIGAVISHAERNGFLDKVQGFANAFGKGVRFSAVEQEVVRTIFDKADLRAIFGSAVFSHDFRPRGGGGEAAFWFPLIGLLSGMRLDEMAQLRICDLRQDEESGRWFFDIARDGGRSTKTASSIRCVPLHRELERIGLLHYRQSLLDKGASQQAPLWPEVKANGERQRSSGWSKWFGRYLRHKVGIADSAKVFHSFRHTFKRMTRDAGLSEELHDALTGHAGSGSVGRSYGRGYSLGPLFAAMDKVAAPVGLAAIVWAPVGKSQ